jgi:uncharacterized protein YggT (Ycf19 family)
MVDDHIHDEDRHEEIEERREEKHEARYEREATVNQGVRVVWFIVGLILAFLLVRVILALLGANLENPFANFIYSVTDPFVAGFRGLLRVGQFQAGVSRLELETLVAMLVYALIGWGIASAIQLFSERQ